MKKILTIVISTLLIITTIFTSFYLYHWLKEINKAPIKIDEKEQKPVEKYDVVLKAKLEKLDFINEKISYFDYKAVDKYIDYLNRYPDLNKDKIVLNVNMNLDRAFYTGIKEVESLEIDKLLVNKYYSLGNYTPSDLVYLSNSYSNNGLMLRTEVKNAFETLAKDAKAKGLTIKAMSGYRSYGAQQTVYNNYVKRSGQRSADTYSARAGHSEHQTGLTLDVYNGQTVFTSFKNTKEYLWMKDNAHKYGFIQRYLAGKEKISGFVAEEWHYRYLGVEMATQVYESSLSYDEYYVMHIKKY